jgi:predicted alpha/beta hydrolase family esterase
MKPLLFIHGTGTRRGAYDKTLAVVKRMVDTHLKDYSVKECYWGEPHGSKAWVNSLPQGPTQQQIEQAEQLMLWRRLLEDPFYQLRLIESLPAPPDSVNFGATPGEIVWQRLTEFDLPHEALAIIAANELEPFWAPSLNRILTDAEDGSGIPHWQNVIESAREDAGEMRAAVANCLVAQMMVQAHNLWIPPISAEDRARLGDLIVDQLGGVDKGLGSLFGKVLFGAAILLANPAIRVDRGDFSTETGPAAGDILLYQARGDDIRAFVQQRIEEESKNGPVLIVAHSLGGLACLDLLINKDLWSHVRALVTVGSQASYLYEIGALWSLKKAANSKLPDHFPSHRWLNILNRWDFLSYPSQKVFPEHASDREVGGLSPFPLSHSAYWKNADTWREIRDFIK